MSFIQKVFIPVGLITILWFMVECHFLTITNYRKMMALKHKKDPFYLERKDKYKDKSSEEEKDDEEDCIVVKFCREC